MKRPVFILIIAISSLAIYSCSKASSIKNSIEGTWGLTHHEYFEKIGGEITEQFSRDYNPFAPSNGGESKIVIINTVDDNYLVSSFDWDQRKSEWVASDKLTWSIKGGKVIIDGQELSFHLTDDTLVLEGSIQYEEDEWEFVSYGKLVYRKMNDLSE